MPFASHVRRVVVALTLLAGTTASAQSPPATLFSEPNAAADAAAARNARGNRWRQAAVYPDRLLAADGRPDPFRVRLNLFPDVDILATTDGTTESHLGFSTWSGRIEGSAFGEVTLTAGHGVVVGTAHLDDRIYEIRAAGGAATIEEIDPRQLPRPWQPGDLQQLARPTESDIVMSDPPVPPLVTGRDDDSLLDVLALYTPAARIAEGGAASVRARIAQAVSDTNIAYLRSGVLFRIRLVGIEEIAFSEATGSDGIGFDLSALRDNATARARRDALGADLVALIVDRSDRPGIAFNGCSAAYIYVPYFQRSENARNGVSVTDHFCLGNYSFAYALGANLGAACGRDCPGFAGAFSYSQAYRDPLGRFRTVMAMADDRNCPPPCPVTRHFSNPQRVEVDRGVGAPTGTSDRDNARTLNEVFDQVSAYRSSLGGATRPSAPTGLRVSQGGSLVTLAWNPVAGATSYVVQVGTRSSSTNLFDASVGSQLSVSGSVPRGRYFWRVIALNDAGSSDPSAEADFNTGVLTLPNAPSGLSASVSGNAVSLSWLAPIGGGPPNSYAIEAGRTPGADNIVNFLTGTTATSYTATGVPNGTYFIRVRAANEAGRGPASNEVSLTVGCDVGPGLPTNLRFSVVGREVTLTWDAPASGGPPAGYRIDAGSTTGASDLASLNTGSTATTFSTPAPPGRYFVRVRAVNACGVSGASNEVTIVVN